VGNPASRLGEPFPFLGPDDAAMGHYRVVVNQSEPVIDVSVVDRLRKQRQRPVDFRLGFIDMGVEVDPFVNMAVVKLPGEFELERGAGRGEARNYRVELAATAMPFGQQFLGQQYGAFCRRVFERIRQVAVLEDLPRYGSGVVPLRLLEESVDRSLEGGGEDIGGGGAV
jgi:hypothetical protein